MRLTVVSSLSARILALRFTSLRIQSVVRSQSFNSVPVASFMTSTCSN